MLHFPFWLLLLLFISVETQLTINDNEGLIDTLLTAMRLYIKDATEKQSLSEECRKVIDTSFLADTKYAIYNLNKLVKDSSINQNDITSYGQCMHRKHGFTDFKNNSTFLLSSVNYAGKSASALMFGICAVQGCNETEYKQIIVEIGQKLGYIHNTNDMNMTVTSISDYIKGGIYSLNENTYIYLLPCSLILIHLLLMIFNKCSYQCIKKLFSSKEEFTKGNKLGSNLKKVFSLRANWGELIDFEMTNSGINNDSGITYIQGIRGVFMILIVYGFFLLNLFNAPVAVITERKKESILSSWFYSFFFCGLRFAPKILYSCSGFCLGYKLLCYLDETVEDEMEHSIKEKTPNSVPLDETTENEIEDEPNNSITYLLDGNSLDRAKALNQKLSIKHALKFIARQIHKYFMMVFTFIFVLYTLYYIIVHFKGIQPTWVYFQKHINTLDSVSNIFLTLTSTLGFVLSEIDDAKIGFYFCIVYNEFIYFILGTFIIYFGYKYKFRVDSLFLFMIFFMFIGKVTFYCIEEYKASNYTDLTNFAKFDVSTYYNFIYFLIGTYFSFGNYTIQKGIVNYEDAEQQQKPYLFIFVKCIKTFKRMKKGSLFIFGAILFLINLAFCFGYLLLKLDTFQDKYASLYYLFDTEFFVLFTHLYALIFYIKGDNVINTFLTLPIWSYFSKIYFSFIMLLNTVIVFVIYQSETRIKFDLWTLTFYSTLCLLMNFVFSTFSYIFFELPYKRMIKISFSKRNIENNIKVIDKGIDFSSSNLS